MGSIFTIFKKELIDTMRDRRTIITMVVVPLLVFPVLIMVTTKISISQAQKAKEKKLRIAVVSEESGAQFKNMLANRDDVILIEALPADSIRAFIRKDSLDGAFVFSRFFDRQVESLRAGKIKFYFRSTEDQDIVNDRLEELINEYEEQLLSERFKRLELDKEVIKAIDLTEVDIATAQERIGKAIGGFLPYIFVIFCFVGSMYPAIDLAAGEKERGTLETLLTSPVNRFEILLGKFGVVVLTGIGSALVSILGLYIGIRQATEIPPEIMEVIRGILELKSIALLFSLLLPLTIFFAGILLTASMYAKTFKEAQSIVSPLSFIVILPVAIGLIPGVNLDSTTALIPILNVSLATKEIISGTIKFGLLFEVYVSLIVLALLSLYVSSRLFLRESVIFRG
ncbi:ABC transporter permease [candidate division KSB1 bacterium]|nr:ABC transporter permease [candidate division KSB1 bacterium]NIR73184.1 ABC transporter permease [candidate division KSB1 bacterium]NIS28333.1 ABC transporter permease [candidate division KSB1 bacterium]NIT75225.1 ABC transporter permease [candidate division KSB1 bacterium]NIU29065.1 ABC transporter permease [candidate division KSB1 bacterium]